VSTPVPPFRLLDPALTVAETLLAQGLLADVAAALPDERAAAARLNAVLDGSLRLRRNPWRLTADDDLATAALGLALLVVVDGWRRLKRCEVCAAAFVDRTNGCSRRRCGVHRHLTRRWR
jgi:predicted RNA-binding Zn ribbon-like protein